MRLERTRGRLIYGGSFNPLHIGHMRLALECREKMAQYADTLEFLPAAAHPQKDAAHLLPFKLRAEMIKNAIKDIRGFSCNEMEGSWAGPSYTFEILKSFSCAQNNAPLFFIIGSQDFALLPTWWKGLRLPEVCNLVVAPRGGDTVADFCALGKHFWPDAVVEKENFNDICMAEKGLVLRLPCGSRVFWLNVPQLDISASRIRKLWLCGRSTEFLMPGYVTDILNREEHKVRTCWEGE